MDRCGKTPEELGFQLKWDSACLQGGVPDDVPERAGVYCWTLEQNGRVQNIYVGSSRNLNRRLKDYCRDFQPHAPNDFKLQAFQQWVDKYAGGIFRLYAIECAIADRFERERKLRIELKPILMGKMPASSANAQAVRAAYIEYYESVFRSLFDGQRKPQDQGHQRSLR